MNVEFRRFAQVDVFTDTPYLGNPVAVVLDGVGLSDETMLRVARWTNLSETTFVLPATDPTADYQLRIFTPGGELPFAGHPTLGSAHAWLEHGGVPQSPNTVVQQCPAGLITLNRASDSNGLTKLNFKAPTMSRTGDIEVQQLGEITRALGITSDEIVAHQIVDNGPGWVCIQLDSAEKVLALNPKFADDTSLMLGVIGAYPADGEVAFEVRAFAPRVSVYEDPVTGSLNASVAQWLFGTGKMSGAYKVRQGTRLGRKGTVDLSIDADGEVWVGGATVTCVQGTIAI